MKPTLIWTGIAAACLVATNASAQGAKHGPPVIAPAAQHAQGPPPKPAMPPAAKPAEPPKPAPSVKPAEPAPKPLGPKAPVAQIAAHPKLVTVLQPLLPPQTNIETAAAGFKNLGQFVAAVHVSKNLDIPFTSLKAKMTGAHAESLGRAIQDLKPGVKSDDEAKRGEREANEDLKAADRDDGGRARESVKSEVKEPPIEELNQHAPLVTRLTPLVPSGMTLTTAASGFKNLGQFVAALHVSKNLGIPFAALKADMTGAHPLSLGEAIQALRPGAADAQTEAKRAETEARVDIRAGITTGSGKD